MKLSKKIKIIVIALVLSFTAAAVNQMVYADEKIDELQEKSDQLQEKIKENEKELEAIQAKADTLENKIAALDVKIGSVQDEIELSELKIEKLEAEIQQKEEELKDAKEVLADNLRALYKSGDVTPTELVAASSTFNEFVDTQKYLDRLKSDVQKSAEKTKALKGELEDKKQEQESVLNDQRAQRTVLDAQKEERADLLAKTRGEEAEYQKVVADLQSQRAKIEQELDAYIASLSPSNGQVVSYGRVNPGDIIGKLGNTGFSTGPHLHFKVLRHGALQNPYSVLNAGYLWPVPGSGYVSQGYGCVPNSWYPQSGCAPGWSFHDALDIAGPEGLNIVAPAAGDIVHRGCLYAGTVYSTYAVIINHDNGIQTVYVHLQAPNASYDCNRSTITGALSVQN